MYDEMRGGGANGARSLEPGARGLKLIMNFSVVIVLYAWLAFRRM